MEGIYCIFVPTKRRHWFATTFAALLPIGAWLGSLFIPQLIVPALAIPCIVLEGILAWVLEQFVLDSLFEAPRQSIVDDEEMLERLNGFFGKSRWLTAVSDHILTSSVVSTPGSLPQLVFQSPSSHLS